MLGQLFFVWVSFGLVSASVLTSTVDRFTSHGRTGISQPAHPGMELERGDVVCPRSRSTPHHILVVRVMQLCVSAADISNSSPCPAQGWQWLDEDWHIDMTGHEDACVDNEGWYYAVDFNWLKHPPGPGSGRFKRVCQLCILLRRKIPLCSFPYVLVCSIGLLHTQSAVQ